MGRRCKENQPDFAQSIADVCLVHLISIKHACWKLDLVKSWGRRRVELLVGLREISCWLSVHSGEQDQITTSSFPLFTISRPCPVLSQLPSPSTSLFGHVHWPVPAILHSSLIWWMQISVERKDLYSRALDPVVKEGTSNVVEDGFDIVKVSISVVPFLSLTDHSKKMRETKKRRSCLATLHLYLLPGEKSLFFWELSCQKWVSNLSKYFISEKGFLSSHWCTQIPCLTLTLLGLGSLPYYERMLLVRVRRNEVDGKGEKDEGQMENNCCPLPPFVWHYPPPRQMLWYANTCRLYWWLRGFNDIKEDEDDHGNGDNGTKILCWQWCQPPT